MIARPTQGPATPPKSTASTADSATSAPPAESFGPKSAQSALSECVAAISLVDVTVHSLESQQIAAPEQEVLNRAIRALWSVHNWIYDRMWSETEAERAREREGQP